MREQVTLTEINDTQSFADGARRYFRMPGIVKTFYPGVPRKSPPAIDVQPAVHDVRFDTTTGERYSEPWPLLYRVPVRYPGGGGLFLWWDLKAGDKVDLEAYDLDPGAFLANGQPSDPASTRRNAGCHWVAVPGDVTDGSLLPAANGAVCIGTPNGVMVAIDGSTVNLGARQAPDGVGVGPLIDQAVTTIVAAFNAHTHGTGSGPTTPPTTPIAPLAPTGSKSVKLTP